MDNKPSPEAPDEPRVDWTSYHENNESQVDVGAMAALVRRVGGELSKIDSQSVSNSTHKAERIDKQKLINELSSKNTQPVAPPTQAAAAPASNPTKPVLPPLQKPLREQIYDQSVNSHAPSSVVDDLEKRISRLESSVRTLRKTKKIKRGASYKVSSNSVKGVIKDAELVAEFVISELAKGVKSITIKLDESTDTQ